MLLETSKDQISINQLVGQKSDNIVVEGDVIVNDVKPDVLNIINTYGMVYVYKKDIMEGKARIDGSINTYIMYISDDANGTVRSLNTVLDFTQIMDIDNIKQGMTLDENVNIVNFECKILNGRKINVKATLEINARVYLNEPLDIINNIDNIEDIQTLNNNRNITSLIGEGTTKVYAKDTIILNDVDNLAEIMKAKFKVINKDTKVSYNKVLAKADAEVNIMYLTEDNRIETVNTTIPVMGFVELTNVNENDICDTKYKLKNILIKPNNTNENSIYVEAEIEIICFAYETRNINIIEDIYSLSSEINFRQKEIWAMKEKENLKDTCKINEQISIPEIGNNKLYMVDVNPVINNTNVSKNKISYQGEVNLELMFQSDNTVGTKNVNLPFDFEIESQSINENSNIDTNVDVKKENFFVVSDGNIESNIELGFDLSISKNEPLNIINEVSVEECRQNNSYSMIIYFVKPGDTLWEIAKKFKSTVEDIARVNNIEDVNMIYPNTQLYIPKYIRRNVAV